MGKTIPGLAEPVMLKWCREKAHLSIPDVAGKLGVDESLVKEWEAGTKEMSFAKLNKIANLYKRAVATFWLKEPPREFTLIRDFRRLPGSKSLAYSPALAFLIRAFRDRQEWLAEYFVQEGDGPVAFVGSVTYDDDPIVVGKQLRTILGASVPDQKRLSGNDTAFRYWRDLAERSGVCVFVTSKVEVDEMRGFALSDKHAPVVVVNGYDSYAGKTFSLLHEMAHILLGIDGVSNRDIAPQPRSDEQRIEVFCNAVSAEALVPSENLQQDVLPYMNDLDAAVVNLAAAYRVSEEVIARRLFDVGIAGRDFYERKRAEFYYRKAEVRDDDREVIIPKVTKVLNQFGARFSRLAVSAFHAGAIGGVELANFLNMRLQHLSKLESRLAGKTAS